MKLRIWTLTGWLALLLMLGVVGGMDTGRITIAAGIVSSFALLGVGAVALRKAGWLA